MLCGRSVEGGERANGVEPVMKSPSSALAHGMLQLTVTEATPGVRVLHVIGEVDLLTAPKLEEGIHQQLADSPSDLIIDLTGLSFIACAGIHVLNRAHQTARRENVSLELVCTSPTIVRILRMGGTLQVRDTGDARRS
jgi:anti-sigma B factor antagonist